MRIIWTVFIVTGVALVALSVVALRWRGDRRPVFRTVGRFLLALALVTALFPIALPRLGPALWAAAYIGFVAVLAAVMTWISVARDRRLRS